MAKQRKTLGKIARFRLRFTFWLDMNKPDEHELAETIETLKTNKHFAKTIRDGIKLVVSLMDGRLDVLFELFPWVREEMEKGRAQQPINAIEAQLARLEKLMEQNGTVVDAQSKSIMPSAGPKPLIAPTFAIPQFGDDDQDTIIITKSADTNSSANFINGLKSLQ